MPIRCIFFLPDQQRSCQVLQAVGAPPLSRKVRLRLESRYCQTGAFISCPIFTRIEQELSRARRELGDRAALKAQIAT
jgi:hypothetical protein